jgi:hypothetical protein
VKKPHLPIEEGGGERSVINRKPKHIINYKKKKKKSFFPFEKYC